MTKLLISAKTEQGLSTNEVINFNTWDEAITYLKDNDYIQIDRYLYHKEYENWRITIKVEQQL